MGKGAFSPFPTMFSTLLKKSYHLSHSENVVWKINVVNLDNAKIISYSKQVNVAKIIGSVFEELGNILGKGEIPINPFPNDKF